MSGWREVRWATKSNGISSNEPGAASGMRLIGCSASTTPPSSDSPVAVEARLASLPTTTTTQPPLPEHDVDDEPKGDDEKDEKDEKD